MNTIPHSDIQSFRAPKSLCYAAAATWPAQDWAHWHKYNDAHARKLASHDSSRLPEACKQLIDYMAASIPVPDRFFPDFDLHGSGMHWMLVNGFLNKHYDSSIHPIKRWYRKLNAILFLSGCSGGELIVDHSESEGVIYPEFGSIILFPTNLRHEVRPVTDGDRKTLSLFWWCEHGNGVRETAEFV